MAPGKRKPWSPDAMRKAVEAVKKKEMGFLKASRLFKVPRSTLENYVNNKGKTIDELLDTSIGRKPVLGRELESELVKFCKVMDERFYGLRIKDIRVLAYQLAFRNKIRHPFTVERGMAGKKWLKGFFRRHPELCMRTPEKLSLARIKGFTKEKVHGFFKIVKDELTKISFNPNKIYNVDETGVTVVQGNCSKVISIRGKKSVSSLSSAERGSLITTVICMNASGHFIPPLLVFPRKNMKDGLLNGTPPGTVASCHPSGWIQLHIFTEWFRHFINIVKPTTEDPVVLLLDGHYSHTRNLDIIEMGRAHGVNIICFPPHTTHKLQPLDVAFMAPFKRYYSAEIENWLQSHKYQRVSDKDIGPMLGRAYSRAATIETAANGFKKCGILPLDPLLFTSDDFLPMTEEADTPTTDQPHPDDALELLQQNAKLVSPFHIAPPPILPFQKPSVRSGQAAVITGSPFKNKLEDSIKKIEMKKKNLQKHRPNKKVAENIWDQPSTSARVYSKKIERTASSGERKTINSPTGPKRQLFKARNSTLSISRPKKKRVQEFNQSSDESDLEECVLAETSDEGDSDSDECIYCTQSYRLDKGGEKWMRCISCLRWAHELCAGSETEDAWKSFKCDHCRKNK